MITVENNAQTVGHSFDVSNARWLTVDDDRAVVLWGSDAPPVYQNGAWQADTDDLAFVGFAGGEEGHYPHAAASLRRMAPAGR